MNYVLPLVILINFRLIQGVLEWTVVGKVTDYGQNVTLFCNVPNCCPKDAGWDRWTPRQRTLFIDVKTGRPNKKYDGKVVKDGYTLIIQNLTKSDLNVSYSCLYGVTLGEIKFLLRDDVFIFIPSTRPTVTSGLSHGELAALITGVIVLVSMTISIWFRRRIRKKRSETFEKKIVKNKEIDGKKLELGEVLPLIISETIEKKIGEYKEIGKEEQANLKEKIRKIENKQEEVIPKYIRDQIQEQIQDWEKKDKMFVSTRASNYVMKRLEENSCLTLTAPSGVGKSFIARHTAIVLKNKGYNIIPVNSPTDIFTYYQPEKHTVFIVDDICGNFTANQHHIENWKQLLPVIYTIIADKCCKIIVSCRLQVYKDERYDILLPFKSCECNLISEKLCLTHEEKISIAYKYIAKYDINELSQKSEFFPLLCSLYDEKTHGDVTDFFANPHIVYIRELDNLKKCDDLGKYKICSLALCVLFNNQLREEWFDDGVTDEQRSILEDTCEACEINRSTSKKKLRKELNTLDGTFICKQNGIYSTVHDKLFDILAHYFGQKMVRCLIDNSDSNLVHERLIWQNSLHNKNNNIEFIIEIPDKHLESYIKRFIKDWSTGNVRLVIRSNNMKVSSFRQHLIQHLNQLDKKQQIILANTKDIVVPTEHHGSGTTPLIHACYNGYTEMVQWLIHNDVNLNQCRDDGVSGLLMACKQGNDDIVRLLLEKNSIVNIRDYSGWSPLYVASYHGQTGIVRLLLKKNPNVDLCDDIGRSPLYKACASGHFDTVKLLLESNADCNICAKSKQFITKTCSTQLGNAADARNKSFTPSILQFLSQKVRQIIKKKSVDYALDVEAGASPLHIACFNGSIDIVRCLLDHNANINMTKEDGTTPLFYACEVGHEDIVHLLVDRGAFLWISRLDGNSLLTISRDNGHSSIENIVTEYIKKQEKYSL